LILVGDIGGTKTRLALYDAQFTRRDVVSYACKDFRNLEAILATFLRGRDMNIAAACFGVPGPVIDGRSEATNLPWQLNESSLAAILNIDRVLLVNDLVATANALPYLAESDLVTLHRGQAEDDTTAARAVLAPGTGLGQAYLTWDGEKYVPHPSEGGHADFAPTTEQEVQLYRYMRDKYPRVSYERIYCGPGLVEIYAFLKDTGQAPEPEELLRRFETQDPAAVISTAGQSGEFDICVQAMELFVAGLGSLAGNLVLTYLATGGVYLGGGIPPKILPKLQDGTAVRAYLDKGRLSKMVQDAPFYVIRDDHAALLGAAHMAAEL